MPLDIGIGILFSLATAHLWGVHAGVFLISTGVLFALLPDVDMLPFLWPTSYNHRSFFHYPLLYVPLALLVYYFFGALYGTLFALCIFAHFVHDTMGIGWGVAWLAPLSPRKFLFPEKMRRERHGVFMTWLPEEEKVMASEYHDPHWVQTFYFRPNPIAYVEYGVLFVAIIVLYLYLG